MDISPREKERRQKIQKRRRQRRQLMLYAAVFLVVAVTALGFIISGIYSLATQSGETGTTTAATTTVPTTTTTTVPYPTLPAETVSGQVGSRAVLLYDATHDTVLYRSSTAGELLYPASVTKLLTAIVACEATSPDTVFTVGSEIALAAWDASKAYISQGAQYTLSELLDALLLESGADAAYCIAVNVARLRSGDGTLSDEQATALFVSYMNEKAQQIGTTNSYFVTPDGYHDMYHHSTADDLLKIALYADSIPLIHACVATPVTGYFQNTNMLLHPDSDFYYPYAIGMKTGFTDEAGYCLAASAEKDGVRLYAILLAASERATTFEDARALFEMGFALAETQGR